MIPEELTILLVEDDDVDVMMVKRVFKQQKVTNNMVRAANGLEALEAIKNGRVPRPFIVLLDLNMPKMSGLEFIKYVRRSPELQSMVIFVLTTSQKEEDVIESYNLNVAGYFLKEKMTVAPQRIVDVLDGYWKLVVFPESINSK